MLGVGPGIGFKIPPIVENAEFSSSIKYVQDGDIRIEENVPDGSYIESKGGSVEIVGSVGNGVFIISFKNMNIRGSVGIGARLEANGGMKVEGDIASRCSLLAIHLISASNISDGCSLISKEGRIVVRDVGNAVYFEALKERVATYRLGDEVEIHAGGDVVINGPEPEFIIVIQPPEAFTFLKNGLKMHKGGLNKVRAAAD